MTEYNGRRAYTREEIRAKTGLSTSALEKAYRARELNGHPVVIGKVGRNMVWDAEAFDTWWADRTSDAEAQEETAAGALTFEALADKYGITKVQAQALWDLRDYNDHPAPIPGAPPRWDAETYDDWYQRLDRTAVLGRGGSADDEITLAEAARVMGVEPKSISGYPNRPPVGWPDPVDEETSPGGKTIRRYRRGDIWDYVDGRQPNPGGHKPVGAKKGARAYPYQGDQRLQVAREALAATPASEQSRLPKELAEAHGGTPGTWSHILTTARNVKG